MSTDSSPQPRPGTLRAAPASLCPSCLFVREVAGRRQQRYLLCRNEAIPAKYPQQPVIACAGYEPGPSTTRP